MLRLFRFLIWGDAHMHKWKPYGDVTKVFDDVEGVERGMPDHRRQSFQCEICGEVRMFKV